MNQRKADDPEPEQVLSPVEHARVTDMEDEMRKLWIENEFRKEAAAFFARTQP